MGNCFSPSTFCSSDHSRRPRRRLLPSSAVTSEPPDDAGLGHSFCYVTTPHPQHPTCSSSSYSLSGAALPANTSTALSTSILSSSAAPFSSAFDSSTSFSSFPLHPIPRFSPSSLSAPLDRGFLSGPLDRRSSNVLFSGPLNESFHPLKRSFSQGGRSLMRSLSKAIGRTVSIPAKIIVSSSSSSSSNKDSSSSSGSVEMSDEINNNNNNNDNNNNNLQWAQGKAGEDRVHVVVSEEHGWLFVGIYDGFNGPDATDYLLSNLYTSIRCELEGMVWVKEERDGDMGGCDGGEGEGEESRVRWKCTDSERRDHGEVLKAMDVGLRRTEEGFLGIAADVFGENPELGLMGSCVLVAVMKGEDLYVMNVGDSRAVLGQRDHVVRSCSREESFTDLDVEEVSPSLSALQLTLDHSTCVQEEVRRIRSEHPDDDHAVVNNRVKGSLKVTRAFGAGFLKQPKWNDALLEVFRIDYVGTSPYITCTPFLHHHRLGPRDKFLILSSDGLYQYFTNEEVVAQVEHFIAMTPEGDPAQHLVEEVIFRAAKKAGLDFHELLEIPQGDRRRYHDDVSIIVISFEGRIWRSCV